MQDAQLTTRLTVRRTPWDLAEEYDLFDLDGSRPHGGRHYAADVLHAEPDRPRVDVHRF